MFKNLIKLTIIFFVFCQFAVFPQWIKANGPYSAYKFNCMVVSGSNIYAGSEDGVFVSKDEGSSWQVINNGLPNVAINLITASGDTIIAVSSDNQVFLLAGEGGNWVKINNDMPLSTDQITSITISGNNILVGKIHYIYSNLTTTQVGTIFLSKNNGANWTRISDGLPTPGGGNRIIVHGDTIFVSWETSGVCFSTNYGSTWTSLNNGIEGFKVISLAIINDTILVGTWPQGVYRSTNRGASWSLLGLKDKTIRSFNIKERTIVAATLYGLYISYDNGLTWSLKGFSGWDVPFAVFTEHKLFAGTESTYFSLDNGLNWSPVKQSNKYKQYVTSLIKNGNDIYACAYGGIFHSSGIDLPWDQLIAHEFVFPYATSLLIKGSLFLSSLSLFGTFRSTDSGKNWSAMSYPNANSFVDIDDNIYMCTASKGVYTSSDSGATWTSVSKGLPSYAISDLIKCDDVIIAGVSLSSSSSDKSCIFYTTDKGANWQISQIKVPSVHSLCKVGSSVYAGTDKGVYKSDNKGISWAKTGYSELYIYKILSNNGILFAGTEKGMIWSNNNGADWFQGGFENYNVISILICGEYLCACTSEGISYRKISEITEVKKTNDELPAVFSLEQNYPNPFNPTTVVDYSIKSPGTASLKIYNTLGQEVRSLFDEFKSAGKYSIKINLSDLPGGVYFYKLKEANHSITKKMVLLK